MAQVIWTAWARYHLDQIAAYIAERSPDNADRVIRRVIEATEKLAVFPGCGRAVPQSEYAEDL